MITGKYDRIVTIQYQTSTESDSGANQNITWNNLLTNLPARMAIKDSLTGDEDYEGTRRVSTQFVSWIIMYPHNVSITPKMKLVYNSLDYEIISNPIEIGRREELELVTQLKT